MPAGSKPAGIFYKIIEAVSRKGRPIGCIFISVEICTGPAGKPPLRNMCLSKKYGHAKSSEKAFFKPPGKIPSPKRIDKRRKRCYIE
jgi:hypothetical protein